MIWILQTFMDFASPQKLRRAKTSKIRIDFGQLWRLIPNISGNYRVVKNQNSKWSTIYSPFSVRWKKIGELRSTNKQVSLSHFDAE